MKIISKRFSAHISGFTLIETIIVFGIFLIIFTASWLISSKPITSTQNSSLLDTLISDMRTQQSKSMSAYGNAQTYGVYFEPEKYFLFAGAAYNASDPKNVINTLPVGYVFQSIAFPSSQVVFARLTGEIAAAGSVVLRNTATQENVTISLSALGVPTITR